MEKQVKRKSNNGKTTYVRNIIVITMVLIMIFFAITFIIYGWFDGYELWYKFNNWQQVQVYDIGTIYLPNDWNITINENEFYATDQNGSKVMSLFIYSGEYSDIDSDSYILEDGGLHSNGSEYYKGSYNKDGDLIPFKVLTLRNYWLYFDYDLVDDNIAKRIWKSYADIT